MIVPKSVIRGWVLALCFSCLAQGQTFELDLERFLNEERVVPKDFSDGLWKLEPPPGRSLMLLPIRIPSGVTAATPIEKVGVEVGGGQFVGWYIPPASEFRGQEPAYPQAGGQSGRPELNLVLPRISRQVELRPGGQIGWKAMRGVPGGKLGDPKQPYAMFLDPKLVPLPPKAKIVGGQGPTAARQRLEAQAAQRQLMEEYQRLTQMIRKLPSEFQEPAPPLLYAVYYSSAASPKLTLTGEPPLPWSIKVTDFNQLREAARGRADDSTQEQILNQLTSDGQAFSARVAAAYLASNGNIAKVPDNGPLLPLVKKLATEGGPQVKRLLAQAVLNSSGEVPIAPYILQPMYMDSDPVVASLAIAARAKDLSRRSEKKADLFEINALAQGVARLLVLESGPPVDQTLQPLFDLAAMNPELANPLAAGLSFGQVPALRRKQVVALIVARARQRDVLALRWLDRQLLGSGDAGLTKLTLENILVWSPPNAAAMASTGGAATTPALPSNRERTTGSIFSIFNVTDRIEAQGKARSTQPLPGEPSQPVPGAPPAGAPPSAAPGAPAKPEQPIPLDHPQHGLFKALAASDESVRQASWQALDRFEIVTADTQSNPQELLANTYLALAETAVRLDPTPVQAVDFLTAQKDAANRAKAMDKVIASAKGPARLGAILYVAGSNSAALAQTLQAMTPDQRVEIAVLWYGTASSIDRSRSIVPSTLGLLRQQAQPNTVSPMISWFAGQVSQGQHPTAVEWAAAMSNEAAMVTGLADADAGYAKSCAAALVATVLPPDDALVEQLYGEAMAITASVKDPNQAAKEIEKKWDNIRATVVNQRLQAAAGVYNLSLRVLPPAQPQPPNPSAPAAGPVKYDLGQIVLAVNSMNQPNFEPIKLDVQVNGKPLGLKLTNPAQLAEFPPAQEADLKNQVPLPASGFDLTLDSMGRWTGTIPLPDQRLLKVTLTPVKM